MSLENRILMNRKDDLSCFENDYANYKSERETTSSLTVQLILISLLAYM